MDAKKAVRRYLVPGAVFQSSIIAGGYGTGREVMEFVSRHGALGGLAACMAAIVVFTVVLSLTYELARMFDAYDYHGFTKSLLGPAWIAYEISLLMSMVLVTAVIAAAAGQVLTDLLPVPPWVGVVLMLSVIVILNYFGRATVIMSMGVTAVLVTIVLIVYSVVAIAQQPDSIVATLRASSSVTTRAVFGGATFAMYNCLSIPVLLFAVRGQESRTQTFVSGVLGGVFAVVPAILLHLSFVGNIPDLIDNELPTYWMLKRIDIQWITTVYLIVLFATVVQSGVGVLHGLNERIDNSLMKVRGKGLSKVSQAMISGGSVVVSGLLAQIGIVALIASGYSYIALVLFFIYLLPLITLGAYRVFVAQPS